MQQVGVGFSIRPAQDPGPVEGHTDAWSPLCPVVRFCEPRVGRAACAAAEKAATAFLFALFQAKARRNCLSPA